MDEPVEISVSLLDTTITSNDDSKDDGDDEDIDDEHIVPDGGWGWVVCFGSFIVNFILDGTLFSFGVLMLSLLSDLGEDKSTTSWIGSAQMGIHMIMGPIISILLQNFSIRQVTIAGTILSAAGFIASVFAPNVYVLIFTYGVIGGVGFGMVFLPAIIVVGLYFSKKRAIATGISTSGSGLGTFAYGFITDSLLDKHNWRGTILILAGLLLNCVVCGMLFRPLVTAQNKKKKRNNRKNMSSIHVKKTLNEDHQDSSSGYSSEQTTPDSCTDTVPKKDSNGAGPNAKGLVFVNHGNHLLPGSHSDVNGKGDYSNVNADDGNSLKIRDTEDDAESDTKEMGHNKLSVFSGGSNTQNVTEIADEHCVSDAADSTQGNANKDNVDLNIPQPSDAIPSSTVTSASASTKEAEVENELKPHNTDTELRLYHQIDFTDLNNTNVLPNGRDKSNSFSVKRRLQNNETHREDHRLQNGSYHQLAETNHIPHHRHQHNHLKLPVSKGDEHCASNQHSKPKHTLSPPFWFFKDHKHDARLFKSVDHIHHIDPRIQHSYHRNVLPVKMNSEYKLNDFVGADSKSPYGLKNYCDPHNNNTDYPHSSRSEYHNHICKGLLRPILRKDIYYSGSVNHLPAYQHYGSLATFMAAMTRESHSEGSDVTSGTEEPCTRRRCFKSLNKWFPVSLLTDKIFVLLLVTFTMWTAQSVSLTYLPDFAVSMGIERSDAAFLISIVGIANVLGRLFAGFITDCFHIPSIWLYVIALAIAAVVNVMVPYCQNYALLQACSAVFGLCMAVAVSMRTIVLADQLGIEVLTESFGLVALFQGVAFSVNPPIAGKLIDDLHSFKPPFIMAAIMYAISAVTTLFVACLNNANSRRLKRERREEFEMTIGLEEEEPMMKTEIIVDSSHANDNSIKSPV